MVDHILQQCRIPGGGWKKQPYFAVTVPDHMGLERKFTFEGLVHRVNPDTTAARVDVEKVRKAMYETFLYRGLFTADGSWDSTVFKDENASTLSRNYAAAHLELANAYRKNGEMPKAIAELQRVERMFPGYLDVLLMLGSFYIDAGDTARAIEIFTRVAREHPNNPEALYYYGLMLLFQNRADEALRQFDRGMQADPDYPNNFMAAVGLLMDLGQRERATQILEQWVARHPDDERARLYLENERRSLGLSPGALPLPAPAPGLPGSP
jgi:tetratricopeptide (TPR) repeat protein